MTDRLSVFLKEKRGTMSLRDFAYSLGISHTYLDSLEKGVNPKTGALVSVSAETLKKIADRFGVTTDSLLGRVDSPTESIVLTANEARSVYNAMNFMDVPAHAPILGSVSAGIPLEQQQDILGYWPLPPGLIFPEHFWLRVNGDSMEPLIPDGALVLIKQTMDCKDGSICCLNIESETTIKRVYRFNGRIELVPENTKYQRKVYQAGTIMITGVYAGHFVQATNGNGK